MTKSIIKYLGGKSRLLPTIYKHIPSNAERFIDVFTGSAVVAMNCNLPAIANDINPDLINMFQRIKSDPKLFTLEVQKLFPGGAVDKDLYFERRELFNSTRRNTLERATLLYYLNRHGYNGLMRYNKKGEYNVANGTYKKVEVDTKGIQAMSEALQSVTLMQQSFEDLLPIAGQGDVVYLDPPYVPLSNTADFTSYSKEGFSYEQQVLLKDLAEQAQARGATVIISNHNTDVSRAMYSNADEIEHLLVTRTISVKTDNRENAKELLAVYKG